jgi:hypothetical protein
VKPAALAALALTLLVGCYSTTPHRAGVDVIAKPEACADIVRDVFARSAFIQIPGPPNLSMLFSPRMSGLYSPFLATGVGVGVVIAQVDAATCHVTLEAVSPDVSCPEMHGPLTCGGMGQVRTPAVLGAGPEVPRGDYLSAGPSTRCPTLPPLTCSLSYAPGASNDAAVDELARRLRERLGPLARVD